MAQTKHKLDIFKVLGKISTKDKDYYPSLLEEEKKALAPLVVMRWMTGTDSAQQIYFLNELVNPFVFNMANHKELLVDLMTICAPGHNKRYKWMKAGKRAGNTPKLNLLIGEYFGYSTSHAADALPLLSDDQILDYATELGKQPPEIKEYKKELKKR